jgi:putative ATP-dependent endonuclease of OLD family
MQLRISNFQSFGRTPTIVSLEAMTFLLGPNGSGKTAALQALARVFAFDRSLRQVRREDFHCDATTQNQADDTAILWIELQFEFAELKNSKGKHPTIPSHFVHMRLVSADGVPRIRFRLTAELDEDGDITEQLCYVIETDENDEPVKTATVSKHDRNAIQVHYLPARRDPSDHVSYAANSLLGRALRSANWTAERDKVSTFTRDINATLSENLGVDAISQELRAHWESLHSGQYYSNPKVPFASGELDHLLRHLTVGFGPSHSEEITDFSRLSDGQKSLLNISIVLSLQAIGRKVLADKSNIFYVDKLRPALFTLVAIEEPENSLSPHYLGRVVKTLKTFSQYDDAQTIIATHSPSLLKRVAPEEIRFLRLGGDRQTVVRSIIMPDASDEAHKFVREAVLSFPELYFSRLVILGEGDSEEILLPRLLQAKGLGSDDTSISVVPLGGRHVNHFWRLLHGLDIPHVTLLDMDLGRHSGGWGRIRYALQQLLKFSVSISTLKSENIATLPKWNSGEDLSTSERGKKCLTFLESHGVFFSTPLDIDFTMMLNFPTAYGVDAEELNEPGADMLASVLGQSHGNANQYTETKRSYFGTYHRRFKLGSKPAAHLQALADLDDPTLISKMPKSLDRLFTKVKAKIAVLPE